MTLGELIAQFRTDADDTAIPHLWSDEDLTRWFNEAEIEACRRAHLLRDSTTADIVSVTATSGNAWVDLDPRIIRVLRARPAGRSAVYPVAHSQLDDLHDNWEDETGAEIKAIIDDMETLKLRTYPVLTGDVTMTLTVDREPLTPMVDPDDDSPEIHPRYHIKLIPWVLYRAYSVDDVDTLDPDMAARAMKRFESEFGTSSAHHEEWLKHNGGRDLVTGHFA